MGPSKTDIRESTIQYCKSKAKERKNNILIMENKLNLLNERLDKLPDRKNNELFNQIKNLEKDLKEIYSFKAKGAQVRSRIKWVEEGEKILSTFYP